MCAPCAIAAASTVGAPVLAPVAFVGYVGYKINEGEKRIRKNTKKKKYTKKKGGSFKSKSFKRCLKKCSKKTRKKKITCKGGKLTKKSKIKLHINTEDKIYAYLSYYVYKTPNERIIKKNNYILNVKYSNEHHTTHINNKKKHIIIAFRGTHEFDDIKIDLHHMINNIQNSKRFKKELRFIKKIKKLYKNYKITYTGHSIGGSIACEMVNIFNTDNAIVFNSGHGPFNSRYNNLNIKYYSITGDIISYFGLNKYDDAVQINKKKKTIRKKHKMKGFITTLDSINHN